MFRELIQKLTRFVDNNWWWWYPAGIIMCFVTAHNMKSIGHHGFALFFNISALIELFYFLFYLFGYLLSLYAAHEEKIDVPKSESAEPSLEKKREPAETSDERLLNDESFGLELPDTQVQLGAKNITINSETDLLAIARETGCSVKMTQEDGGGVTYEFIITPPDGQKLVLSFHFRPNEPDFETPLRYKTVQMDLLVYDESGTVKLGRAASSGALLIRLSSGMLDVYFSEKEAGFTNIGKASLAESLYELRKNYEDAIEILAKAFPTLPHKKLK